MHKKEYCLGFDTSNYTTSVAIVDDKLQVVSEAGKKLNVKLGEKGLRQSQALFEHMGNVEGLVKEVTRHIDSRQICAVAVSNKPRPLEHSYMPVFLSGKSYGETISHILKVDFHEFSHQEGHIEAIKEYSLYRDKKQLIAFHLSGGTTEILQCEDRNGGYQITQIGGSKDLAIGQLIDRVGVKMGLAFPCGSAMDALAQQGQLKGKERNLFKKIHLQGLEMNLSGMETQVIRCLETHDIDRESVAYSVFDAVGQALAILIEKAKEVSQIDSVIMAGGVSSSSFIRNRLKAQDIVFGKPEYSTDNAVGIALLGMKRKKHEAD